MSKRFIWALGILTAGLLVAGCNGGTDTNEPTDEQHDFSAKSSADAGTPLATVDGMTVGTNDFDSIAKRMRPRAGEVDDAFKQEVMDELVNETLLYQEALRQGIDQDPKIRKMMVNTLLKRDVYGTLDPDEITEDELKAYFEEHKEDFVVPEKVQVKRILVKISDELPAEEAKAKAGELRQDIANNPSQFKTLAQANSQGPYAKRGGDLGFIGRKGKPGIDQEIIDAAFEMEKGEVSEVIESANGFNILYVPNRRERVERTFEQMRGSVLRKVKSDRYTELYDNYVGALKEGAAIEIDETALTTHDYKIEQRAVPTPGPVRPGPTEGDAREGRSPIVPATTSSDSKSQP